MSSILYNLIISPIELVVEIIFELMFRLVGQHETNQGLAVIGVSIAISLLTLPLYKRADAVQQKERDIQKKLSKWTTHIRKTFKGDERFMMQQAYYRENGYSPMMALNGSISLLLEIPFFIAAYHFLSHLQVLDGASFGPIANLGKPDELIKLGNFSINLLPVLMTTINCISSAVYLKGFPLKDKVQTYGMALIFLVLLYNSPSGLVVYWTCNNIFSLVKNIFYKLKNPKKVAVILCAILGTLFAISLFASGILNSKKKYLATFCFMLITYIPMLFFFIPRNNRDKKEKEKSESKSTALFILQGVFITILIGILIPSAVIASSPAEFVDLQNYRNPLLYLINSTCYAAGFFLLWTGIIRYMMNEKYRPVINLIFWIFSGIFLINYMCFGRNLGILSSTLVYENKLDFSKIEKLINLLAIAGIICLMIFIFRFKKIVTGITLVLLISTAAVSINQIHKAQSLLNDMSYIKNQNDKSEAEQIFTLSKNGKNVIVFMLDRAISGFIPYVLEERPELKEIYSGFTYYPNTISYGAHTIFGAPPLFGGYEYTPQSMNERSDELLVDKHNEALKLLPVLFLQNDFDVTVCDLPLANYKWVSDFSIFADYPQIKCHHTIGMFNTSDNSYDNITELYEEQKKLIKRNFFCFGLLKVSPVILQSLIYDDGDYYISDTPPTSEFLNNYMVLQNLTNCTLISDDDSNHFIAIDNETTHNPMTLYYPDYTVFPTEAGSDSSNKTYFKKTNQNQHYDVNMASLIQIGKWITFMKENDVYDNTKIIIVSDHGYTNNKDASSLGCFENLLMDDINLDVSLVNPLFMMKDFNSKSFTINTDFMTNADTPTLALKDIIDNPVNPFTGNKINSSEKEKHPQLITTSHNNSLESSKDRTTFDVSDGKWYSVQNDITNKENWKLIGEM